MNLNYLWTVTVFIIIVALSTMASLSILDFSSPVRTEASVEGIYSDVYTAIFMKSAENISKEESTKIKGTSYFGSFSRCEREQNRICFMKWLMRWLRYKLYSDNSSPISN